MKKVFLWVLAFLITATSAVFQRVTGPTYPVRAKFLLAETEIKARLARSHESHLDYIIEIQVDNPDIQGYVLFKRHNTDDAWTQIQMTRKKGALSASLPKQPPAGKLDYKVFLTHQGRNVSLSGDKPVTIRFKGTVPGYVLWPHVLVIFLAMLFSTRAGLEALRKDSNPYKLALWTTALLVVGGFILGPIMQKLAFGSFWTGVPFGYDLTDNKTLIAIIGWVAAVIAGRKGTSARLWVLMASILTLGIFLIPHSVLGSSLDYSSIDSGPVE